MLRKLSLGTALMAAVLALPSVASAGHRDYDRGRDYSMRDHDRDYGMRDRDRDYSMRDRDRDEMRWRHHGDHYGWRHGHHYGSERYYRDRDDYREPRGDRY